MSEEVSKNLKQAFTLLQSFATLDLISRGRAEMVVGRGSSIEAFPLFGYDLKDYDELFAENLVSCLKFGRTSLLHGQVNYDLRLRIYRSIQDPCRIPCLSGWALVPMAYKT